MIVTIGESKFVCTAGTWKLEGGDAVRNRRIRLIIQTRTEACETSQLRWDFTSEWQGKQRATTSSTRQRRPCRADSHEACETAQPFDACRLVNAARSRPVHERATVRHNPASHLLKASPPANIRGEFPDWRDRWLT